MTQNTDQDRELFEAFASDNGDWLKAVERDAKGNYRMLTTNTGWLWWQAACSALANKRDRIVRDLEMEVAKERTARLAAQSEVLALKERIARGEA